jgi:hypothetical protein
MKNVAATSGQRVSLATAFFVEGNTREGTCAGSDTVLNFFSRPPITATRYPLCQASALAEYKVCVRTQEENTGKEKMF